MHILYLDESGGPNSWEEQSNFVLGGIAVHDGQIFSLTSELNDIQEKYFPEFKFPINFHANTIRQGKKTRFKKYCYEERNEILNEVYDVIGKYEFPKIIAFATVIDASAVINYDQVCRDCFQDVCKNFNQFLHNQFKGGFESNKGLLIIDHGREGQYRKHYGDFKKSDEAIEYFPNVVDIPYFAASKETRMLQIADFIANAVFRFYEFEISDEFNKIAHVFYKGLHRYPVDGLNHITEDDSCQCSVCLRKRER